MIMEIIDFLRSVLMPFEGADIFQVTGMGLVAANLYKVTEDVDDTSVTYFDTVMPSGWNPVTPAGSSISFTSDYMAIETVPGATYDGPSVSELAPSGPRVFRSISGSFDFAVAYANVCTCAINQGFDLLALGPENTSVRVSQYMSGLHINPSTFAFHRWGPSSSEREAVSSSVAGQTNGPWPWQRLAWNSGTGQFTWYMSRTGFSGSWVIAAQWTSLVVPNTFQIYFVPFTGDAEGREMRVVAVVDLIQRGSDDATVEPPATTRSTVQSVDFTGQMSLPAWLTAQTNNGGTVQVDDVAELVTDMDITDSYAWLEGPDTLSRDHGMLVKYRIPQPSVQNSFFAPTIRTSTTTDLPASQVLPDKYRPGVGTLAEVNGAGAFSDFIRILDAHPVSTTETYGTGAAEFRGFQWIFENEDGEVDGETGNWIWVRMEMVGPRFRARFWYDGGAEPSVWHYEADDYTQLDGTGTWLVWSHNDGA